ncbi:MAG: hypothetical protein J3Q66DRAFT_404673 [Benniella sp.]|nr:MAG: hypothetical protein J3Q66DRAFT_404673 [Benniella sp.]
MVDQEAGTGACYEGASGHHTSSSVDDPSVTTGVAATPEPVSMNTEGTRDHSSSTPSHPNTPLLHHHVVPVGNTGTTTEAVANGRGESSQIVQAKDGVVDISHPAVEESTMKALFEHTSTLEALRVHQSGSVTSNDRVRNLASCPNLCSLIDAVEGFPKLDSHCIHANVFMDQDQNTGALVTLACEASLKELKIKIMGVPRLRRRHTPLKVERDSRSSVRATCTIDEPGDVMAEGKRKYSGCLEMSLESGLYRLSEMEMLKELDVSQSKARIGVQEVEWMTEHWLRLRVMAYFTPR